MSKSSILFSVALGGLVLAGCNKDETPTNPTTPSTPSTPATTPSMPGTGSMPTTVPGTTMPMPTSLPSAADLGGAIKSITGGATDPTTAPSIPSIPGGGTPDTK